MKQTYLSKFLQKKCKNPEDKKDLQFWDVCFEIEKDNVAEQEKE